ncbi:sirohydrochlorin chelatase [Leptolyngbya sp. AN02str]|uniref:sirohydrochlorin chelatase n=1 Tax=Leptolyngbya sp. AN02str TaxID=3423363 RepID=UPI003D312C4F
MVNAAYLLVSHGSRDARSQSAMADLAGLVAQQLRVTSTVPPLVEAAVLELGEHPLHWQIEHMAQRAIAQGYGRLNIVPLFLLPGVHVMEDIPHEVAIAEQALGSAIAITVCPYLGSHPHLASLIALPTQAPLHAQRILISHGSKRPQGNQPIEAIAASLNAIAAYWSVPPSLEAQVAQVVMQGCQHIAVLPYFLFPGGITDAIAQQIEAIGQQYPYVRFYNSTPIGTSVALADMVLSMARSPIPDVDFAYP